jgi:hypothetical protein
LFDTRLGLRRIRQSGLFSLSVAPACGYGRLLPSEICGECECSRLELSKKPFPSGDKYQKPLDANPISEFARDGTIELERRLGSNIEPYRTPLAVITEDHTPSGRKIPRGANGKPDAEAARRAT